MSYNEHRMRYLEVSRRQLRQELDEMGYGQRPQTIAVQSQQTTNATGFIMAFATVAILFLSLSLSRFVS